MRWILILLACACGSELTRSDKVKVVATTGMVADLAKVIGGEHVEVTALMGPGVDPHLYKASAGDVRRLAEANLILYNGLHLEAKMGEVLEEMNGRTRTVGVADGIDPARLLTPSGYAGAHDPHVWFDVALWMTVVERVRDALIERDPDHTDHYRARANGYLEILRDLDERVRALEHGSGAAPRGKAGKRAAAGRRPAPASRAQEQQEYDAAFNLMKQGFYDRAVKAFRNFIASYPDSSLVGNAQYWIAEANYVVRNFKKALEEFKKVVKEHPKSAKVPDALLKIGYTHYELEQWEQARASLNDVVKRYPNTRVAKSAERRLRTMKQEGR